QDLEAPAAGRAVRGDQTMSEFLRVERKGPVATLWIDRQPKMNTMTVAMRNEFPGIFAGLEADEAVRVVVVRGAGRKAFSAGGTQRALRLIGMTRAKLFMMTGQRISAERAEAWGLITQAVADDQLDGAVDALAGELAERAPLALRTLKMVLNRGADAPLETALELERKSYAWLRSTHDYEEGVRSFVDKRPPKFEGR